MEKLVVCMISIFICSFTVLGQHVVYVNPSSSINGNGTSWSNAYNNLPDAIANAPQNSEVWLAKSAQLYTSKGSQTEYIILNKKLGIYGGFIGTETLKIQRPSGSKSIISGDLSNLDINSSNASIAFLIKNKVTVDGVIFRDFNCPVDNMGIILADTNAVVDLNYLSFYNNQGGAYGGICINANYNAIINMDSVLVLNNNSDGNGILISRSDSAIIQIKNSLIKDNGLSGGGGFVIYSSVYRNIYPAINKTLALKVYNSSFINNGMAIEFNYFGSSLFQKCNFLLKPSGNHSFTARADSAQLVFDSCNIEGKVSANIIESTGLKKLAIANTKFFNITIPSNSYVIYSSNTLLEFTNSIFKDLNGSYVFYMNNLFGKIKIDNCKFIGGTASSHYMNVYGKTLVVQNSLFKNIKPNTGNYYFVDSALVRNTTFDSLNTNDFFYSQFVGNAVYDSCLFSNVNQTQPLFSTGYLNRLWVKNSIFQNISQTTRDPKLPILFWNVEGTVNSTNNLFDRINTSGHLVDNRRNMTVFGNVFKNISTDSSLFLNSGMLRVFNSNFVNTTITSFQNDTIYGSQPLVSFKLMNTILYSTIPKLIKVRVKPSVYNDTLSYCLTNQSISGSNMYNFVPIPYENLYSSSTSPLIQDKGQNLVETNLIPTKDIQGNTRIKFGNIDIGAIEIQNQIPTEIQVAQSVISTSKITYYPNPVEDVLVVDVAEMTNAAILDLKGEVKRELSLQSGINQIATIGLPEGMYVLRVQSESGLTMVKWIKK